MPPVVSEILELFANRGNSQYGFEAVTQQAHALQAADLAWEENADDSLIAAALLHDIGHLLHGLPDDAAKQGIDDFHENSGAAYLRQRFPAAVYEPVRLHVAAKRYLCSTDPEYMSRLSEPSRVSFQIQGGFMSAAECEEFRQQAHHGAAIKLRHWDDAAKTPDLPTRSLQEFIPVLSRVAILAEP